LNHLQIITTLRDGHSAEVEHLTFEPESDEIGWNLDGWVDSIQGPPKLVVECSSWYQTAVIASESLFFSSANCEGLLLLCGEQLEPGKVWKGESLHGAQPHSEHDLHLHGLHF
jgi:hypothetical protein